MNNIHNFEGRRPSKMEKYGIENVRQVLEQLEVSKPAYENAIHEISKGNLTNLELLKETEKNLVDFREIVTSLAHGAAEDIAASKEINKRLAELREKVSGAEEKIAKLA